MLLSTLNLGAGLFLCFLPTTSVRLKLLKSRASFPTSPATSPAFAAVQRRPNEGRYGRELLRHRPQQAELSQIPELKGSGSKGNDEVLFALADPDHCHSLFLRFTAWVVSQMPASSGSKVGRHQFVSHLNQQSQNLLPKVLAHQGGTGDGTMGKGKNGSCRLTARPLYRCYWGCVYC